jgi:DNA polymerase-3 subunit alpha
MGAHPVSGGFCHLHVHTEYSVLDGAIKVSELLDRCQDYGMRACAISDHGAMFGVVDFYQTAKSKGIKPIIGSELYIAPGHRTDRSSKTQSAAYNHLLLLCKNETGYRNLCKLSSIGYLEGFHYKPRIDFESLSRHAEGLIASTGCLRGVVPQYLLREEFDEAEEALQRYLALFGAENFFVELQDHGLPEQRRVNPRLVDMARRSGLMLAATNDCHYLNKEDAEAHDALLCVQTNRTLEEENRFRFQTKEFHFKSPEEMRETFAAWPEAITNTEKIADLCELEIPLHKHLIPKYSPPPGKSKPELLRELVMEGLRERYHGKPAPQYVKRAEYELGVIEQMGFVDYFLVVWDLIKTARDKGIPVGPGRGSGAGSLVAYALTITNIDPLRYNLLFERFLNPDRVSMPDFDLDFCYTRRPELIEYVREKYGQKNVSQIITFGRMLAKQVIRNVGRVMGMNYGDVDRIAKLVPDELKITLKDALEKEPELKRQVKEDPQVARLWSLATRLEGTIGTLGTHAAGVIICDEPLTEHVPLFQASGSDVVATQFEMKTAEQIGLLKMDFLGLRTLTVVHDAVRFIEENRGVTIDIDSLEPDDSLTYELLRSGRTTGIFQLESSGMRDLSRRIGLESLEEVCALVALYRPGPMQLKDQYIENKHNPAKLSYDHPLLEPILKETYGVALYQEQVMQIVQALAGFSLGQADELRRAMAKKKADLMEQQGVQFLKGAKENGIDTATATSLFQKIEQFAGYGFNKSHSMAYAFVAYQTAFLKANYPVEFMAALLTSESGNLDKVAQYIEECRRMGIEILPPDVNHSCYGFNVEGSAIRFGMGAVKNVGRDPVEAIQAEREANGPYADIFDFCARLDSRVLNRRVLESLNRAGAFESTGWNRRQVEESLESALSEGQINQRERAAGQTSLLELMAGASDEPLIHKRPDVEEWPENQLLAQEKEVLGLYVSSHPLARHATLLERFSTITLADLPSLAEGHEIRIGGLVSNAKIHVTQRNRKMAFVTLETLESPCEVVVFPELYEQKAELLVPDMVVMLRAKVSYRNDEVSLLAEDIVPIDDTEKRFTEAVHIRLSTVGLDEALLTRLAELLDAQSGSCDVFLHCVTPERDEIIVHATPSCMVAPSERLCRELEELLGEGCLWYSGANGFPRHAR